MPEPTSTTAAGFAAASLTGSLVVLLGPLLGPWIAVLLAAIIGSLWTIGRADTPSRWIACMLALRTVLTAVVLTGVVAAVVSDHVRLVLPDEHLLPAVSFGIALMGDRMDLLKDAAISRLRGGGSQ